MEKDNFYKYTTSETTEIILANNSLRWSSPTKFNDILEFERIPKLNPSMVDSYYLYMDYIIDVVFNNKVADKNLSNEAAFMINLINFMKTKANHSKEDVIKIIKETPLKLTDKDIENEIKKEKNKWKNDKARVLCLTKTPVNKAMWGNYCDNHYGCVLGFKNNKDSFFNAAKKVEYTDNPNIGSGLDIFLYGSDNIAEKYNNYVCFTKSEEWKYEEEWRLLTWRLQEKEDYGDYKFEIEDLDSITFGYRMSDTNRQKIIKIIKDGYINCKIYEILTSEGVFQRKEVLIK
jgi:hypothetical protein